MPYLIVNADDFGQSPGVNRGIAMAHDRGVVTSASLMVRPPAAAAAADYARSRPRLSVGLHVDLGEWKLHDGEWVPVYEVVRAGDGDAVDAEVGRQVETFRRLVGQDPTHLDSHQHLHRRDPLRSVLGARACELGVPLRHFDGRVRYCGDFYGQTATGDAYPEAIELSALEAIISALPDGVTELACHPGLDGDLDSMYRAERERELRALCDPGLRSLLTEANVELISFRDLPADG